MKPKSWLHIARREEKDECFVIHCECCVILTMCTNYNVVIKSSTNQKFVSNVNSTVLLYIQVCDVRQVKEREEGGKKGRHQTVPKQPKLSK